MESNWENFRLLRLSLQLHFHLKVIISSVYVYFFFFNLFVVKDSVCKKCIIALSISVYFCAINIDHTCNIVYFLPNLQLKQIGFNVPSLHLGHVAKSFALREPPSKMKDAQGNVKQEKKKKKEKDGKAKNKNKLKQLSEFSSGL